MVKNNRLAILYALIAVAMWSTVATAFKLSLEKMSLLQLLSGASFFSLLILTFFLIIRGELIQALASLPSNLKTIIVLASLNPTIYYLILFKAYELLPAQIAQSLNYTWSITLILLSVPILGHKLKPKDIVAIILGYSGVVCIIFSGTRIEGGLNIAGIFLALLSTLIWAAYWLINTRDQRPPIIKLFQSFLLAFPLLCVITFYIDGFTVLKTGQSWLYIAYVGLFEMGFAFICWQLAMHHTDRVGQIGTLIFLSPIVSLVIISFVLGEQIYLTTVIGLILIIGGILYQQYDARPVR